MDPLVNQDPVIMDREWITLSFPDPRFIFGIRSFLKFAREHLPGREIILCPCTTCRCARLPISYDDLEIHLMRNGFDRTYRVWNLHGEHASPECTERASSSQQYHSVPDLNKVQNVVVQEFGGNNLDEKLNELYSSNHASRMTSVDDAPTQLVGPDSRRRMRGLGCSISKTRLKKSALACSKANTVTKEKESLAQEILEIKKTLADIKAWMSMQQEARSGQNPSTPPPAQSS